MTVDEFLAIVDEMKLIYNTAVKVNNLNISQAAKDEVMSALNTDLSEAKGQINDIIL